MTFLDKNLAELKKQTNKQKLFDYKKENPPEYGPVPLHCLQMYQNKK